MKIYSLIVTMMIEKYNLMVNPIYVLIFQVKSYSEKISVSSKVHPLAMYSE